MSKHYSPSTSLRELESRLGRLSRWAQLKRYQFEVTFAINVYTPGEKLVFWSIFIGLFAIFSTAILVYVPLGVARALGGALRLVLGDQQQQRVATLVAAVVNGSSGGGGGGGSGVGPSRMVMSMPEAAVRSSINIPDLMIA
ncbi:hypothetical protein BX600DRAFT_507218 [Xylariales sp. PMI_506]|nr:hypothetical protein BX600DRAFT_507218 [Xylariales sp. PMI_506]